MAAEQVEADQKRFMKEMAVAVRMAFGAEKQVWKQYIEG